MSETSTRAESENFGQSDIRKNSVGVKWSPHWLGESDHLYRPDLWRSAGEVQVARLRQIFIWPLVLQNRGPLLSSAKGKSTVGSQISQAKNELAKAERNARRIWKERRDLLDHASAPRATRKPKPDETLLPDYEQRADAVHRYGEFVYFYDFLQTLLFRGKQAEGAPHPIHIYAREDVTSLETTLLSDSRDVTYRAHVDRCNLYLFGTGAAALVTEIDFGLEPSVVIGVQLSR